MPHILLAGKLHPAGLTLLDSKSGFTYRHVEEVSEASYAPFIAEADAIVIRTQPMSAATIVAGKKLKVVSRHGVGYDAVDVAALTKREIPLTIVGDVNSNAVAEHAMMLVLAASRRLVLANESVKKQNWGWRNTLEAREVAGKHLLIIGYGRIGRLLARMASGFGVEISAYDPILMKQGWPDGPVRPETELKSALAKADIVSIHIPKSDRPIIGAEELKVIKPGAIIINTARGGMVDELALAAAIRDGRVGAAGLDVFDSEPPQPDHPLLNLNQVIATPHNAALTRECGERMAVASVQNVIDFFSGQLDSSLVVNGVNLVRKGTAA